MIIIIQMLAGIILLYGLFRWLKTLKFFEAEDGQQGVIDLFKSKFYKFGRGIPDFPHAGSDRIIIANKQQLEVKREFPRIGKSRVHILIWPLRIRIFIYRYKRYMSKKEAKEKGAFIIWKSPQVQKLENTGSKDDEEKSCDYEVLAEVKEYDKVSLFGTEIEDIELPFESEEKYTGSSKATMTFIVWEVDLATKNSRSFKELAEKASKDVYRQFSAKTKYDIMRGISFKEAAIQADRDNYFDDINEEIYEFGVYLVDINILDVIPDLNSEKLLDADRQRKIAAINALAKQSEAEGIKTIGEANNTVAIGLETGLKQVEVDVYGKMKEIDLTNAGRALDKFADHKAKVAPIVDKTTEVIASAVQYFKGNTLVLTGNVFGGQSSGAPDIIDEASGLLTNQIAANLVTNSQNKKGGGNAK